MLTSKPTRRVLVAEDDADDVETLTEAIRHHIPSAIIDITTNGVQCIRYLQTSPAPSLVFLDINMPQKNGMECLEWICNQPSLAHVPVVMFTTSHSYKDVDTCYDHGALYYIVKPFRHDVLNKMLTPVFEALTGGETAKRSKSSFLLMDIPTKAVRGFNA